MKLGSLLAFVVWAMAANHSKISGTCYILYNLVRIARFQQKYTRHHNLELAYFERN